MSETVEARAMRVIASSKRMPLESVHSDSTFESLGIDSLDRLNILFDLENEFGIEINDEEAKKVTTVRQMVDGIEVLLARKAAQGDADATGGAPRSEP